MIYLFSDKAHGEVVHLPLFEIAFDPTPIDVKGFDAIIFTSKNSVQALENSGALWKDKESYAIGERTATYIKQCGGNVVFTAKRSYGDDFAHAITSLLEGKRVFFPRAKEVVSSLFDILKTHQIKIEQRIVYETKCVYYAPNQAPLHNAKLIFTSPSTVNCFLKNFAWDESYIAIVIGEKTAAALPQNVNVIVSPLQSIEHCITLAKAL